MALFTDSDVVTLDDLLEFESSLVQVSSTHGIDVETKIRLAKDEIGDKLLLSLLQTGPSDPQCSNRTALGLSTVVVSPALHRWLCLNSLSKVYAEAYNAQLNTRFQGKWTEYQQGANQAANMLAGSGVGIVFEPLAKPGLPVITVSPGVFPPQALFVQIAWLNSKNEESTPSPIAGTVLNGASSIGVTYAESGAEIPSSATSWNVYASATQSGLVRQNVTAIPLKDVWQLPMTGLVSGAKPSGGQRPNINVVFSKRLPRG